MINNHCVHCGLDNGNAAKNIRAEGLRMLSAGGTPVAADGGNVSRQGGRKSILMQSPGSSRQDPTSANEDGSLHVS